MLSVEVKKLWMGHLVSIRDYTVNKAIKEGGIEVRHDGKTMFLSVEELKGGNSQTKRLNSKFKAATYNLVDYRWKPDDESQEELPF